jgi:hypothetical protein
LPDGFISFPSADFRAGRLPRTWLDALARPDTVRPDAPRPDASRQDDVVPERSPGIPTTGVPTSRSDATRRLRSIAVAHPSARLDARALLDDELAWYRASGLGFGLIVVRVPNAPQTLAETVAGALRSGDSVAAADGDLVLILPAADALQVKQICARVIKRIRKEHRHVKVHDVQTGIAVCPHDGDSASALLARAKERA